MRRHLDSLWILQWLCPTSIKIHADMRKLHDMCKKGHDQLTAHNVSKKNKIRKQKTNFYLEWYNVFTA